ncbi:MAG: PelD GGDEF domain-containing protein [Coxiellaceae bacterium]|nr:PelD GGDEF domain-containing protein [Coxiellaceae bacterium]
MAFKARQWILGFNKYIAWIESIILPTLFFFITFYAISQRGEAFYHNSEWVWLAPILVALRYGAGLGGIACLVLVLEMAAMISPPPWYYPQSYYALEGFFITLLCGQFRSIWHEKLVRSSQLLQYAQQRLEFLSRVYFMTRISHDRMEQNLISKPVTIRSAMCDLRAMIVEKGAELTPEVAKLLLQLLSQVCSFERAGLFLVNGNTIESIPIADVGKIGEINVDDPLVVAALERDNFTYLAINQLSEKEVSEYLVAAPLKPYHSKPFAMLVVERMPFLSLNQDNLKALSVLLNYFSEDYYAVEQAKEILLAFPDCLSDFAVELKKLHRLRTKIGIDSCLVALFVSNESMYQSIIPALQLQQRGLDLTWVHKRELDSVLVTLMPVAETMAVEGYVRRVRTWLKEERGLSFSYPKLHIHYCSLEKSDPLQQLQGLLDEHKQTA